MFQSQESWPIFCLVQLWTVFRLDATAAHKSEDNEVGLCEIVCEMHVAQLLMSWQNAEQSNSFVMV
jgi:hypothetical protein